MTTKTKIVFAKIAAILAAIPALVWAYEYGPDPGYTGAPGDNPTACINAGCHVGTPNSGPGNVKILLPSGNSGTYVPGQAMQILVQITDATKVAYGFQITARMGNGNLTQAGDFSTSDANTQVLCADGSSKANGQSCPTAASIEYMEHTLTGYESSFHPPSKGTYTYSFNWTPPATGSGTVTLYVAANCGVGDPPVPTPTDVYTSKISLTQAAVSAPTITNVQDAESARTSITSGQWVAIYGSILANSSRFWNNSDFTGGTSPGSPLPSMLNGVSVTIGGQPASVYYISGAQLNVLSPSGLTDGPAQVVVTNNGQVSAAFTTTVVQSSPSFFYYAAGGNLYPLAVHLSDGNLVGDPTVLAGTEIAHPGEILEMFVNGITASPGGMIVPVTAYTQQVAITAGTTSLSASAPYLVAAGEFQVNVTLPTSIAAGSYPLTMTVPNGSTATSGVTVTLPVGP